MKKPHPVRAPDGRFVREDGTHAPKRRRNRPVASVAIQRFADQSKRAVWSLDRRAQLRMRQTVDALLAELGAEPPQSAGLLAERIAFAREQLAFYDGVLVELRHRRLLVDYRKRQLRPVVEQHSKLNAELRQDLLAWNQLKQARQLDDIVRDIEALKSAPRGRTYDAIS